MAAVAQSRGKSGQVVAGSTESIRVPVRGSRSRPKSRTRAQQPEGGQRAAPVRHLRTPTYGKKDPASALKTAKKISRKATASARAMIISLTLLVPAVFQMGLAIALALAIGFLDIGFFAWFLQNFEMIDLSAEYFLGGMWIVLIVLNLIMFLYSMTAFLVSGVNVFAPAALMALAICFALTLFPLVHIVPWVLVYVWVVALSR